MIPQFFTKGLAIVAQVCAEADLVMVYKQPLVHFHMLPHALAILKWLQLSRMLPILSGCWP